MVLFAVTGKANYEMGTLFTFENKLHLTLGKEVLGNFALQHDQVISFNFPQQRFSGNLLSLEESSSSSSATLSFNSAPHHCR